VPDDIQVAVPNENYDPTIAKALAGGATATAAEVQRLEAEVRALEERRGNSQKALDEANAKLGTDLAAPERTRTERERDRSTRELAQIAREIERLNRDIKKITNPQTVADAVRPYRLERVQIDVEPGDAKLCTNFTEYVARFGTFSADDPNAAPGPPSTLDIVR
jgi:hypothetical protein